MEHLAERRIPLEVCPSSNVALGQVASLDRHPFDALRRRGVAVSVNSDDPPFFDTTLSDEFERLATTFGYEPGELAELALGAVGHAFLEPEERRSVDARMRREVSLLGLD